MAECSVQNRSVWSRLESNYPGMLNLSATSTFACKVETFLGSSDMISRRGLNFAKGHAIVNTSKTIFVGNSHDDIIDRGSSNALNSDSVGTLIPGLCDDVAKFIMALVLKDDLPAIGHVCKSWNALLKSREFHKLRRDVGTVKGFLYALTLSDDCQTTCWRVFSPLQNDWQDLVPMPGPLKSGSGFAAVDGKLLVVGGAVAGPKPVAVADVLLYDTALNRWRKVASMHTPRYEFACAVLNGLVYVVGGHGLGGKNLPSVEVYDPEQDVWTKLPSLRRARWGCIGCGLEGKIYVMAGRSSFTIGHSRCVDVYDPIKGQWEEVKNRCMMVLTHAIVDQELFCMEWKNDRKLAIYNVAKNGWRSVVLPLAGSVSIGFFLANVKGKLLLFPTSDDIPCDTLVYDPNASSGNEWQSADVRPRGTCIFCTTIEV